MSDTYYRPGLVFKAHQKSQGHQEICRKQAAAVYTPDGSGIVRDEIPALIAEFAVHGAEYDFVNPETGNSDRAADIRGGWFDLDSQAEQKGWGPNEKEIVARHMIRMANARPGGDFSLYSKPAAAKPWPTYDETHHNQIPTLAETLGLVGEALVYESENKRRESVLQKLQEALSKAQDAVVAEESLTAA